MAIHDTPSAYVFLFSYMTLSLCSAAIDAMAEGMTAVVTKLNSKIKALEELNKVEGDVERSGKIYGIFTSLRGFFTSLMSFLGGVFTSILPFRVTAIILGIFPCILLFYTIFVFKENKV